MREGDVVRFGAVLAVVREEPHGLHGLHAELRRAADVLLTDLKLSDRTSGDVWVALSTLYAGVKEPMKAVDCLAQARKLDPEIWPDVRDPYMPDLIKRSRDPSRSGLPPRAPRAAHRTRARPRPGC